MLLWFGILDGGQNIRPIPALIDELYFLGRFSRGCEHL